MLTRAISLLFLLLGCTPATTSSNKGSTDSQAPSPADSGGVAGDGADGGEDGGEEGTADGAADGDSGSGDNGTGDGGTGDSGGGDSGGGGDTAPPALPCSPALTIADRYVYEGEEVLVALSCESGEPLSDYSIALINPPDGAPLSPTDGSWSWTTTGRDGGEHRLVFELRALEGAGLPETVEAHFWVADLSSAPGAEEPDPLTYKEEWGLPVFHIQSSGISETYSTASITFDGKSYPDASIKIRGASSSSFPKNHYTLAFEGADELDLEDEGWDHSPDRFVLISTFDDNSYVRQKLGYDLWAAMAEYWGEPRLAPRSFFTVVYLNGEYHGLYVGIDHVDNEFAEDNAGFSEDGNVYKSVSHDANFRLTDASGYTKSYLYLGWEKKDGEPFATGRHYDDLNALTIFTATSSSADFEAGVAEKIDVGNFMDWFLFVHWIIASDSAGKNAYLYNDPADPIFRFCPWDLNHSFGQGWYTYRVSWSSYENYVWNNAIFEQFFNNENLNAELWARYALLRDEGPLSSTWLKEQIDGYYDDIQPSAERDWERWQDDYYSYWWAPYRTADWTDYEGEKAYLYQWLDDRQVAMDTWYP